MPRQGTHVALFCFPDLPMYFMFIVWWGFRGSKWDITFMDVKRL